MAIMKKHCIVFSMLVCCIILYFFLSFSSVSETSAKSKGISGEMEGLGEILSSFGNKFAPSVGAKAVQELSNWIDYAAGEFAGGEGSEDDPYRIATAEQLAYLAKTVNGGNKYKGSFFVLTQDIDLEGKEWTPIGVSTDLIFYDKLYAKAFTAGVTEKGSVAFSGHFDGNHKKIFNLHIVRLWGHSGLFGYIDNGSFKNIELKGVDIQAGYESGGIVGHAEIATAISNCSVEGLVSGYKYTGGIAGIAYIAGALVDCVVSVDIQSIYYPGRKFADREFFNNDADFGRQISKLLTAYPLLPNEFFFMDNGGRGAGMVGYGYLGQGAVNCNSTVAFSGAFFEVGAILGSVYVGDISLRNCSAEIDMTGSASFLYIVPFF
jgi:hypothetical protein